jgi:hypothetical protein
MMSVKVSVHRYLDGIWIVGFDRYDVWVGRGEGC